MDADEDHREPRGTYTEWLREQGYCPECNGMLDKDGVCLPCMPDDDLVGCNND